MKSFFFILICAVFLGSAAFLGNMYVFQDPVAKTVDVKRSLKQAQKWHVLVASRQVEAGDLLTRDRLEWRSVATVPDGGDYLTREDIDLASLSRSVARQSFRAGDVIGRADFLRPDEEGYSLALLGSHLRAKTVTVGNLRDYGDIVTPGSYIDLLLIHNAQTENGRGREVAVKTLISGAKVIYTGAVSDGKVPHASMLTLGLSEKDVSIVSVAEQIGTLAIALRPENYGESLTQHVTSDLLVRASDLVPEKEAIDPSPTTQSSRDIRIMRGSEIRIVTLPSSVALPVATTARAGMPK
jgi:Flp pilus assembly protein CpaB